MHGLCILSVLQGHTVRTKFLDRSGGLEVVVMVTHRQMVITKDILRGKVD